MPLLRLVVVAVLALAAAACSGTDDDAAGQVGATASPSPETTTITAPGAPSPSPSPSPTPARSSETVPPELLAACGKPDTVVPLSTHYLVVQHAACDLTGVVLTDPERKGRCVVPDPGSACAAPSGLQVSTARDTKDVTVVRP